MTSSLYLCFLIGDIIIISSFEPAKGSLGYNNTAGRCNTEKRQDELGEKGGLHTSASANSSASSSASAKAETIIFCRCAFRIPYNVKE